MFPNIGEKDRPAGPPVEATLSAFDEWAAWQQDFFWAPLQSGCQHPPPAPFLWILIYTAGPLLPVWATRPEEPQTYCISLNCDAKPRTLLNSPRFSTFPHVMDPDRAPFSCSSWHDWIGRAKLACKWRLRFLRHDRAIVKWLWGTADSHDIHSAWHSWRAPKSLSTSFYLFILLLSVHLSIRSSLFSHFSETSSFAFRMVVS